jgi:YggT family protein
MFLLDPILATLALAIEIYTWFLIIWVIMSWLVQFNIINTSNQFVSMVWQFLYRITEPALSRIRRLIPNFGPIDISPIVLILVLFFLQRVIYNLRLSIHSAA